MGVPRSALDEDAMEVDEEKPLMGAEEKEAKEVQEEHDKGRKGDMVTREPSEEKKQVISIDEASREADKALPKQSDLLSFFKKATVTKTDLSAKLSSSVLLSGVKERERLEKAKEKAEKGLSEMVLPLMISYGGLA